MLIHKISNQQVTLGEPASHYVLIFQYTFEHTLKDTVCLYTQHTHTGCTIC